MREVTHLLIVSGGVVHPDLALQPSQQSSGALKHCLEECGGVRGGQGGIREVRKGLGRSGRSRKGEGGEGGQGEVRKEWVRQVR